jgi:hypothetical protein
VTRRRQTRRSVVQPAFSRLPSHRDMPVSAGRRSRQGSSVARVNAEVLTLDGKARSASMKSKAISRALNWSHSVREIVDQWQKPPERRLQPRIGCPTVLQSSYKHQAPPVGTHPSAFNSQKLLSRGDIARNGGIDLAASIRVRVADVFESEPRFSQAHTDIATIGVFRETSHPQTDGPMFRYPDFFTAPGETVARTVQNKPIDLQRHIHGYAKRSPKSAVRESKTHCVPAGI